MRTSMILLLLALGDLASQATAANSPSVTISPSVLTAKEVTPGAQVLFIGTGFEPKGTYAITRRWSVVVTDNDSDGTVTLALDPPVNWNVLWIVADLRNGHYTIAATPGFPIAREHLTKREFKRDATAAVSRFSYERAEADLLYIRPGGAWMIQARDADATDSDSQRNSSIDVELSRFRPLAGVDAPRAFAPGGTLFAIDASRLDLLELKLDGSLLAGAR